MTPLKEIGECLITVDGEEYLFRPSFVNMTKIGEPQEIVQAFYDLHHNELSDILVSAVQLYGHIPQWLVNQINRTSYGRKAYIAAIVVMNACCEREAEALTGYLQPARGKGRTFKFRSGLLPASDILLIAQELITHGVIGKAKIRRLQRHENGESSAEFSAIDYIVAAQTHFGLSEQEAGNLTMTKFQLLLNAKYPDQKGFTRDEYDKVADDYFAKKARKLAKAA
ncbi:DUF6246 family protein [Siccibacter colletis]|uniref:Uncharacterized protein n=1 Tax=Siccibacter colletis TaxID=1505757 RepID=A0ABY6JD03_9ENTR|nr:DUF6246 family protein [Siccibacter colletis]UYU30271.1 hypothetical protein KFZ77_10180 [Siccibacter colletis]